MLLLLWRWVGSDVLCCALCGVPAGGCCSCQSGTRMSPASTASLGQQTGPCPAPCPHPCQHHHSLAAGRPQLGGVQMQRRQRWPREGTAGLEAQQQVCWAELLFLDAGGSSCLFEGICGRHGSLHFFAECGAAFLSQPCMGTGPISTAAHLSSSSCIGLFAGACAVWFDVQGLGVCCPTPCRPHHQGVTPTAQPTWQAARSGRCSSKAGSQQGLAAAAAAADPREGPPHQWPPPRRHPLQTAASLGPHRSRDPHLWARRPTGGRRSA